MKCNALVVTYKKSKRIAYTMPPDIDSDMIEMFQGRFNIKQKENHNHPVRCGGRVVIKISAEDAPYFGGSSAQLSVQFRCDTCGHFHTLANEYTIEDWVQGLLDKME